MLKDKNKKSKLILVFMFLIEKRLIMQNFNLYKQKKKMKIF